MNGKSLLGFDITITIIIIIIVFYNHNKILSFQFFFYSCAWSAVAGPDGIKCFGQGDRPPYPSGGMQR